jgi:hypothetical protein
VSSTTTSYTCMYEYVLAQLEKKKKNQNTTASKSLQYRVKDLLLSVPGTRVAIIINPCIVSLCPFLVASILSSRSLLLLE